MKTKKLIMSLIALFNIALIFVFSLSLSTDRSALITFDRNLLTKIQKKHDESAETINDLAEQVSTAQEEVTILSEQLAQLVTDTTGGYTAAQSGAGSMLDIVPSDEVPEIRATYIIQQVNLKVGQYMSYSEESMPSANRSFPIDTSEDYMIDSLVSRFKAEHNLYGCNYFRLEYVGVQYSASGNAVYVFKCYYS